MSRIVAFDAAHRRLLLLLLALFALLVAARLNGYSTPIWHELTDGSEATELLWGEPQPLRLDDWRVLIPLALSQRAHEPPFPVENELVGEGTSTLVPIALPVAHPVTLLRPQLWGFFLGDDVGIAWMWWSQVLLTFYAGFVLALVVGRGRFGLACLAGLVLVFTPFFQLWAFNPAPFLGWTVLGLVAALQLLAAEGRAGVWGSAALLGLAGAGLLCALYPPYQIVLAGWAAVAFAGLLAARVRAGRPPVAAGPGVAERAAAVLAAAAVPALFGLLFWASAHEAVAAMRESAYPGGRVIVGGGRAPWEMLVHDLLAAARVEDWRPMQNLLNASSFWLLFPLALPLLLAPGAPALRRDPFAWAMLLYALFVFAWSVGWLPSVAGDLVFLGAVPTPRAALGLGLADLALLVRVLALGSREGGLAPRAAAVGAAAWTGLLGAVAVAAARSLPGLGPGWLALALALNAGVAFLVLSGRRPALALGAVAAGLAVSTAWFHPMVRGGSAALRENAVARALRETAAEEPGPTTWAVFDDRDLGSLPRALGLRAVNGVLPSPQPELWGRLDPADRYRDVYNRYANVYLAPSTGRVVEFVLPGNFDRFLVRLPVDAEVLRRLGVTHFLLRTPEGDAWRRHLAEQPALERVRSAAGWDVYRVAPGPEAGPRPTR